MSQFMSLAQMQELANSQYLIFAKESCRFCDASIRLFEELIKHSIIDNFTVRVLDEDFDNATLSQLAINNDWLSDSGQRYPSKPQIYMKGEYIGGNFEFYKSQWNIGQNMPNLKNPFRF
jgi:glutaredoxin-related protein